MDEREEEERALFNGHAFFTLGQRLGDGSAATVYDLTDSRSPRSPRVLKLQIDDLSDLLLAHEAVVYEYLSPANNPSLIGIAHFHGCHINDVFHAIYIDRLGPSVFNLIHDRVAFPQLIDAQMTDSSSESDDEYDDRQADPDWHHPQIRNFIAPSAVHATAPDSMSVSTVSTVSQPSDPEDDDMGGDPNAQIQGQTQYCTIQFKTLAMVAIRLIQIVSTLHSNGVYHLNIKDQNVLTARDMNTGNQHIYLVNFKFAYIIDQNGRHIYKNSCHLLQSSYTGCVTAADRALERRKDLRNTDFAGVLVALMNIHNPGKTFDNEVDPMHLHNRNGMEMQNIEGMFEGYPMELMQFFLYYTSLDRNNAPNYEVMRQIFVGGMNSRRLEDDGDYDWNVYRNDQQ